MIILLHGAWHGAWCWQNIVPLLNQQGTQVMAPNLPGHEPNVRDLKGITLATYIESVSNLIKQANQPVTLVGHSMAGIILSQIAENMPDAILELIYVAAFIPQHNESLVQAAGKLSSKGVSSEMVHDVKQNAIHLIPSPRLRELFYNTCSAKDVESAFASLQPQPLRPMVDPISITKEHFGQVKKRYIICLQDEALNSRDQYEFAKQAGCQTVELNADHSPFFSAPQDFAKLILNT